MTLLDKQMDLFTKEALFDLVESHQVENDQNPCISIYLPTERKGAETQQGSIRLKNLLTQVEQALAERGERTPTIQELLAPAQQLVNDKEFWQYQSDGLALFLGPDTMVTYRLPITFAESTLVNERFYIKPLLPLVSSDGTFYLLTLRQGGVRLLRGTRFTLAEVELNDNTPKSLAEALRYDEFETTLRFHVGARPSTGSTRGAPDRGTALYHGQGGAADDANRKEQIIRFFRQLDNGVRELLEGSHHPPLVLAGIDALCGLYRQVNQYNALVENAVTTDPEALDLPTLHEQVWPLVEPIFTAEQQAAIDTYQHLAGTQDARAADTIEQVVPAAYFQRVDTLFLLDNATHWGCFDPAANQLQRHETRQAGDEDLVDLAALHTLLNGGRVYPLAADHWFARSPLVAILRY